VQFIQCFKCTKLGSEIHITQRIEHRSLTILSSQEQVPTRIIRLIFKEQLVIATTSEEEVRILSNHRKMSSRVFAWLFSSIRRCRLRY
ncbi:hypothetical protein WH50_16385, partial [Pokkaliibacter plantistimulans]